MARKSYHDWLPYLQPIPQVRLPASDNAFCAELAKIRRQGYALEYKEEIQPVMRLALPVQLPDCREVRFAVGIVANFVYLLDIESYIASLGRIAAELAKVLAGKVPLTVFDDRDEDAPPHLPVSTCHTAAEISEFPIGGRMHRVAARHTSREKTLAVG